MIDLYWTKNVDIHKKIQILSARRIGSDFKISKDPNGKPYAEGNPIYFSLSHSRGRALIALCDKPVGVDLKFYDNTRRFSHILSRFTENEKREIDGAFCFFIRNWIIKAAYIKMTGGTLTRDLKRLEYYGNKLYVDGTEANCAYGAILHWPTGMVYAVCAEGYKFNQIFDAEIKLFRQRKGE